MMQRVWQRPSILHQTAVYTKIQTSILMASKIAHGQYYNYVCLSNSKRYFEGRVPLYSRGYSGDSSYRLATSTIFCVVVLQDHTQLFGPKEQKFSSAILDFGGHLGFSSPKMTLPHINDHRITINALKVFKSYQIMLKRLLNQFITMNKPPCQLLLR